MSARTIEDVLREHDDPPGWDYDTDALVYRCSCPDFLVIAADHLGEAEVEAAATWHRAHVAAAIREWLLADETVERVADAISDEWLDGGHGLACEHRDEPHDVTSERSARAALAAATEEPS